MFASITPKGLSTHTMKWESAAGLCTVHRTHPRIIVVKMVGKVDTGASLSLYETISAELVIPSLMFWDLYDLTWYHSDIRRRCTDALLENKQNVQELHACSQSKMVAMGVQVASMTVGIPVVNYPDKKVFLSEMTKRAR